MLIYFKLLKIHLKTTSLFYKCKQTLGKYVQNFAQNNISLRHINNKVK